MLMIYFSTRLYISNAICRHSSVTKILLSLSFCALLLGCDGHSSASSAEKKMIESSSGSSKSIESKPNLEESEPSANSTSNPESKSLISAAKSDSNTPSSDEFLDAESINDSKMQATLIGDYSGIMACATCDSTQVILNLFADGTVVKTSLYDNPQIPKDSLIENGIYRQDDDTIIVAYDDQHIESYLIQNNHLVLLDANKIADTTYTLSRR